MIIAGKEYDNVTVANKDGYVLAVIADDTIIVENDVQIHFDADFVEVVDLESGKKWPEVNMKKVEEYGQTDKEQI